MVWYRQAPSHYRSRWWHIFISPYNVTRPQWVNWRIIGQINGLLLVRCQDIIYIPVIPDLRRHSDTLGQKFLKIGPISQWLCNNVTLSHCICRSGDAWICNAVAGRQKCFGMFKSSHCDKFVALFSLGFCSAFACIAKLSRWLLHYWCAILIAHQLLWQNMEAPVSIFQGSPLAGEPRERLFHMHSVHRYQLCTKYLYPSTLFWQINGCNL